MYGIVTDWIGSLGKLSIDYLTMLIIVNGQFGMYAYLWVVLNIFEYLF